jgi:hypothetical protein
MLIQGKYGIFEILILSFLGSEKNPSSFLKNEIFGILITSSFFYFEKISHQILHFVFILKIFATSGFFPLYLPILSSLKICKKIICGRCKKAKKHFAICLFW